MKKVLITGVAGFVGFHLAKKLQDKFIICGLDFFYPVVDSINAQRLTHLGSSVKFTHSDIRNYDELLKTIKLIKPDFIIHLAACTGVANSALQPELYFDTNVKGFQNILEICKELKIDNLFYASSSSVYNDNETMVFNEENVSENQLSFYGITKRKNEKLAEEYSLQYGINCVGMRFFTVYGSWVRQDMAAWKFMNALIKNEQVILYNGGNVQRDFTHVSDIVESISRLVESYLHEQLKFIHEIYNVGKGSPVSVKEYLLTIAENLGVKPEIIYKPLPENELPFTHSDTTKLFSKTGYKPQLSVHEGVKEMTDWFLKYRHQNE
ncbi:MAG: UDP-N-acetylglucosamine 4-epimerase [Bacteroidia bacterium]|nr:UDP-N-acetylglucosamine 4-epimerase [Bacteroidia bacterium]